MEDTGVIDTPFNIEAILRADEKLYEVWKEHPFYLAYENGRVIIVYL